MSKAPNNKPYTVYTVDRLRRRRILRGSILSLAGLIVVAAVITGSSLLWLNCKVQGSQETDPGVSAALGSTIPDPIGTPTGTDILVLGVDKHPDNAGEESRSDTMILVHVDPDEDYLSILSLPRDLRVEVPGNGTQKLNWAYAHGGAELAIETVKAVTKVDVTEYVEIDFQAFRDLTDQLGGVYVDVDRRYYNDNPEFELIKLAPGYQRLNGADALDYVRFRHDLNYDFGRMTRQQRFLNALREQAMGWNLILDLPGVIDALFDNLRTTLGTTDILKLAYWGVKLEGSRIRQVSLIGDIKTVDGVSYVIPAEGALEEAVKKLMTPPSATSAGQTTASGATGTGSQTTSLTAIDTSGFTTDPDAIENSRLWDQLAQGAPFRVMAPGFLPNGYAYVDRNPVTGSYYDLMVDGEAKPAIKMVYRLTRNGEDTDQYMGIMETTWLDAPAASEPREVVTYNGITYNIVGTNQSTDHVWWIQDDVLYWVSNTLQYCLNPKDLLMVAESMIAIPGGAAD
jgi:LCP family protein required for cell wall assembly